MNGKELTASDIEYSWQRMLGLGKFSEGEPGAHIKYFPDLYEVESITATDNSTIVFKLKQPKLGVLSNILSNNGGFVLSREVIEQYGDVTDWRNVVRHRAL